MEAFITEINTIAWGPGMLVLLLGTGIFLTLGLGLLTLRKLPLAFSLLFHGMKGQGSGDIPPFRALMTSLSATIGTGNIAGVATAIALGGPGALFWMWITALFGLATKYAEGVLAVEFRERDALGGYSGGPMYYIRNGLGKRFTWLATAFALFGAMAGFGLANTVQSNSVAQVLTDNLNIPWQATGAADGHCWQRHIGWYPTHRVDRRCGGTGYGGGLHGDVADCDCHEYQRRAPRYGIL